MSSGTTAGAQDADLTLNMPETMVAQGFDKHLLPRFRFKHRLQVVPVEGEADMVLGTDAEGTRIFQDGDGTIYFLSVLTEDADGKEKAATFLEWLTSAPGKAAIEGFAPEGAALFSTEVAVVEAKKAEVFEGDEVDGGRLALVHCGRCHVVDHRNRMGGIGSTPSFAAIRGRPNWSSLFRAFFVHNPHPSFTQVDGVTEPFDPNKPIHIVPVVVTLDEVEAITAFVATIKPKDLGRPVQAN